MRRITKTEAEDIRDRIDRRDTIRRGSAWYSHGYDYYIVWGYIDGIGSGWYIRAGCRTWFSFTQMRAHYRDKDWRTNLYTPHQRAIYKAEVRAIATNMQAICRRFGIKLLEEKRRKRKR